MIEVRFERGVYLPQQDLWLDPWDAKPFAFISHAHSDHIALHEEIIVSQRTAHLLKSRLPGRRIEHILYHHIDRLADCTHLRFGAMFSFSR